MDHPRKNDRLALIKKKKKKSKGDKISMNIISGVMERLVSDLKGNVDTERKAKEIQLKREEEIKLKQEEERLLEESKERLSYQETGKLSLEELKVLFNRLDYNTFITIVMIGEIRGKHLIALYYGSKKLREYCDRSFQPVNKDGRSIDQFNNNSNNNQYNKNSYDQYLFRLLLDKMKVRIPFGKFPRNVYIERIVGGKLWGFGNNQKGALGFGNRRLDNFSTPTLNTYLKGIIQVSGGFEHSLCVDIHGKAWSFGLGFYGKLGLKFGETYNDTTLPNIMDIPVKVVQVSAGNNHSLCLDINGMVWAFGDSQFGQLGVPRIQFHSINSSPIPNLNNIVQISAGTNRSFFLDNQGRVFTCGQNIYGDLGLGNSRNKDIPTLIPGLENIIQVSGGRGYHTLCLDNQGRVWAFGNNEFGQLGLGDNSERFVPTLIPILENIVQVVAGTDHSFCLDDQGRVWSFGSNAKRRLGLGGDVSVPIPILIQDLENIIQIDCGFYHTLCLDNQGRVWVFGNDLDHDGRLGTGYGHADTPMLIPNLDSVIQVSCGINYSLCIRK